ncbi:MAG: peptidoglycan-binding protein [Christensenellaceae bacterium]|nr:peptidoglycan-binding protein [Christensenellaceae bacterium]
MKKRVVSLFITILIAVGVLLGGIGAEGDSFPGALPYSYTNTGNQANDIVAHAMSQVGYTEGANGWNVFGNSYGNSTGAWCAYFLRWCADKADLPESVFPRSQYGRVADYWETSTSATLTFHPVNDYSNPYTPKKGDIVIYRSNCTYYDTITKKVYSYPTSNSIACQLGKKTSSSGNTIYLSHIGIVVENCSYATNNGSYVSWSTFKMIDGNWGGKVSLRSECFRDITGFVSLDYTQAPSNTNQIGSWPVIRNGSSGYSVAMLQYLLNERIGAGLSVDGKFGALTTAAVKRFQRMYGLEEDGIVGKNTWEALTNFLQRTSSYGRSGTCAIQYALKWRFGMQINIDGGYGPITKSAVIRLQQHFGLSVDGIVGPQTWRAMICGFSVNLG